MAVRFRPGHLLRGFYMACPKCRCKETYHYDNTWDGEPTSNDDMERCAFCGHIFYIDESLDEDDNYDT
jgi:hypothetical protein